MLVMLAALLWWNLPRKVDMADYAPADSFVYLQADSLNQLAAALEENETWKTLGPTLAIQMGPESRWLSAAAWAGIGPTDSVILSRAQIALVILGMNTTEEADTLKIKPEAALIVETHTSQRRIRSPAIEAVKRVAQFAYGQPTCTQHIEDAEYVECVAPGGDRRIVAALEGSLLVVGNTKSAVQSCLEVHRGQRPSLRTDADMLRMRSNVSGDKALAFGYISSANSAKLFSWGAPLLIGKAPGDHQLEQILAVSAAKVLRGVAWSSVSAAGGIEDRFLFSLEPSVISRLGPAFDTAQAGEEFWKLVPETFQSLTIYRTQNPRAAWVAMDSAVSSKLDALSAVVFASLFKSVLSVYGITDPQELLTTLGPPLVTLRPDPDAEGSILIARVRDVQRLRRTLAQQLFSGVRGQIIEGVQSDPDSSKEFAAVLVNDYVLVGKTENVKRCVVAIRNNQTLVAGTKLQRFIHFAPSSTATIVTFTNDEPRLNSVISVLSALKGRTATTEKAEALRAAIKNASFAATETTLTAMGIQRTTRSALGQFSTLLSLLESDHSADSPREP
jgi:hypothetical protein